MYVDKITKHSDIANGRGMSIYDNEWAAQQHHNAFKSFYELIEQERFDRILEIGTAMGGFTHFLHFVCRDLRLRTEILSYDIHERKEYSRLTKKGVDVRIENIFSSDFKSISDHAYNFITKPGKVLILCDGGNKINEFNSLSSFMKSGDFIMAHDFAMDKDFFEKQINKKIWLWHEISHKDIADSMISEKLEFHNQDLFSQVVWACCKKIK
jgi:hypothetical protein